MDHERAGWFDHPFFLPDGSDSDGGVERCVRCGASADDIAYDASYASCIAPARAGGAS